MALGVPEADGQEAATEVLPPLYARWVDEFLGPIPRETIATCHTCAMLAPGEGQSGAGTYYQRDVKCCSYAPELWNFLVGRILNDGDATLAAGRATVEARISAHVGVTPLGLAPPPVHALLYRHGASQAFGLSRALKCPHVVDEDGARCGIWQHRNSVCATWFCKHVRGATGEHFWQSLTALLSVIEHHLARWCVLQLDIGTLAVGKLFPFHAQRDKHALTHHQLDGTVDVADYRAVWGTWHDREREFFAQSGRLVETLSWSEVAAIGGAELQLSAQVAQAAYEALVSPRIPDTLIPGSYHVIGRAGDRVTVATYRGSDPLNLPARLVDVLPYFDGRPVASALDHIRRARGLTIQRSLLQRLVDHRLLVTPAQSPE